jgi:hypothetical protein
MIPLGGGTLRVVDVVWDDDDKAEVAAVLTVELTEV